MLKCKSGILQDNNVSAPLSTPTIKVTSKIIQIHTLFSSSSTSTTAILSTISKITGSMKSKATPTPQQCWFWWEIKQTSLIEQFPNNKFKPLSTIKNWFTLKLQQKQATTSNKCLSMWQLNSQNVLLRFRADPILAKTKVLLLSRPDRSRKAETGRTADAENFALIAVWFINTSYNDQSVEQRSRGSAHRQHD